MSGPLYVPVLPTRPHAVGACRRLWPDVRAAIRPLWNLPPLPGAAPETLTTLVGKYVDPVSAASRHGGWIDTPFGEDAQTAALAEALSVYCEWGRLLPVTGPERTEAQQAAAVLTRGSDRIAVNRSAARRIIGLPEFRGAGAGQGEEWLSDCANGPLSTSEGVGGPAEWLRAGNLQHMTYVVRSLPGA
ncbi:beta family protein [Streptomyces venetus]|uniref:beta family protein n=1 Tax=Streptomyces venetus TaxID=1701086 RepID=UPI003C2C0096